MCYQPSNGNVNAFSVDVTDLFYSLPHDGMFQRVRDSIERQGSVNFQNNVGISSDSFLELLDM